MVAVGFVLSHEQFAQPELVELGVAAEEAEFDMIWCSDHFHPWMDNQGHSGQAWLTIAALGQRTERIAMGTGVTCPTFRYHPAIVAQSFASLGVLYPGRIFLGVGSGEAVNEQAATGQWDGYDERAERLEEAVMLIRRLWSGDWVKHNGRYYQVHNAHLYDLPQPTIPIYIAAGGEQSMQLAGQHGDGVVSDGKSLLDPKMRYAFNQGAIEAGKNPDTMTLHAESFVVVGTREEALEAAKLWRFTPKAWEKYVDNPDPREILRQANADIPLDKVIEDWVIGGDPQVHIDAIQKLADNGVTHIYIHSAQPDQQRVVEFYGREVLPHIQHEHRLATFDPVR
jgi:F420-dependent hydroxymycolic acid dehydrogenase